MNHTQTKRVRRSLRSVDRILTEVHTLERELRVASSRIDFDDYYHQRDQSYNAYVDELNEPIVQKLRELRELVEDVGELAISFPHRQALANARYAALIEAEQREQGVTP